MKSTTIRNQHISIAVKHHGAELCSLKKDGIEYIWQAQPEFWSRHAPVLFPIIGELKEGKFQYEGNTYAMKRHGLARNLPFDLIKATDEQLIFSLKSNASTLSNYPFPFELQISYTLSDNQVIIGYQVINPSENPMYFSIGGHPAFNVPLKKKEKRSDYQLVFNEKENAATQRLTGGLRNGKMDVVLDNETTIPITDELFGKDALVFHQLKSNMVTIQKAKEQILTFDFTGFPYLGIWSSSSDAPFVCIEPWCGVADHITHNQQIIEKEGIVELKGRSVFERNYKVLVH